MDGQRWVSCRPGFLISGPGMLFCIRRQSFRVSYDQENREHAEAVNARLLKLFPKSFSLGETHRPHISILQRYVRTADLDKVYAAASAILAKSKAADWKLKALKYYYIPWKDIGLAGIVIKPTDALLKLQQSLIDAVAPFTAKIGTAAAFVTTPEEPGINKPTIDYVATFVPKASGKNFNPHVTVGIAAQHYLKDMLAEPFDEFTFSPAGASIILFPTRRSG